MNYIERKIEKQIGNTLNRKKSVLLLGPRQTGKSTLINQFDADLSLSFVRPDLRQRYERTPANLIGEVESIRSTTSRLPLVVLDEVQKVPVILDVVQDLIDRRQAVFILSGSSARKLRRGSNINLLPGRVLSFRLDPLTFSELTTANLKELLEFGSLPAIYLEECPSNKELDLGSYVTSYLEEEVRAEGLVRNVGNFGRFLELAAGESGKIVNLTKLSQEIGIAHTTISAYYEILEDCLIIERIDPISHSSTRKKLTKARKFVFFDLGVRRLAAREGRNLTLEYQGLLFEQLVGLELIRMARLSKSQTSIRFWRDPNGPEADWIIDRNGHYHPIEVKWTESPTKRDGKHLNVFLNEYRNTDKAYIICQTPRRMIVDDRIIALPWQDLNEILKD